MVVSCGNGRRTTSQSGRVCQAHWMVVQPTVYACTPTPDNPAVFTLDLPILTAAHATTFFSSSYVRPNETQFVCRNISRASGIHNTYHQQESIKFRFYIDGQSLLRDNRLFNSCKLVLSGYCLIGKMYLLTNRISHLPSSNLPWWLL